FAERFDTPAMVLDSVGPAIAKVADQELAAEPPKRERGAGDAPRGVERPAAGKPAQQMAVRIEHIDKAMAWPRHVVVFRSVLSRVAHEQVAIDVRDAKWRVAGGDSGIGEVPVRGRGGEQAVRAGRPEYIDRSEERRVGKECG